MSGIDLGAIGSDPGLPTASLDSYVERETEALYRETVRTFDAQNIPLTPAMILSIVSSQLRDMDRQIRLSMLEVQGTRDRAQEIGEQIQSLRDLESALRDDGHAYEDGEIDIRELNDPQSDTLREALGITSAYRDDDNGIRLQFEMTMREHGIEFDDSDWSFDVNIIKSKIDNLQEEQRQINAGNEMVMMGLQSAMQQRTQILQTGSNLIASIHDAAKTIVGNLR